MEKPAIIVMKFGGTSLANAAQRRLAAERVCEHHAAGYPIVVVASAMGRAGEPYATDTLLELLTPLPQAPVREVAALAACGEQISAAVFAATLNECGVRAVSLRGFQAGIITDEEHCNAEIIEIRPQRIRNHLDRGEVVVVAGFQGVTVGGEITTLGRGGSDTTAVALGAALAADRVEIYTDVNGIRSGDPQVIDETKAVSEVTHEEAAELAYKGAKVLHPRAAERARAAGVAVRIRHPRPGATSTWLVPDEGRWTSGSTAAPRTTAVTSTAEISQLTVTGPCFFDTSACLDRLFGEIAARGISLDMISIFPDRVAFTLTNDRAAEARAILAALDLAVAENAACAKVTLVGGGIHGIPGIMHRIIRALTRAQIGIRQSVDSNMIISVLVDADKEHAAVRALHDEFFRDGPQ